MKNYYKYSVKERKFSSDVILGHYISVDESGKEHEKTDIVMVSTIKKEQGDLYAAWTTMKLNELKEKENDKKIK